MRILSSISVSVFFCFGFSTVPTTTHNTEASTSIRHGKLGEVGSISTSYVNMKNTEQCEEQTNKMNNGVTATTAEERGAEGGKGGALTETLEEKLEKLFSKKPNDSDSDKDGDTDLFQDPEIAQWFVDNASKPGRTGNGRFERITLEGMKKFNEAESLRVVRALNLSPGWNPTVLELGPGHGNSFAECAKRLESVGGGTLYGMDPSDFCLEHTKKAVEALDLKKVTYHLLQGGVGMPDTRLPVIEGAVDIVYHANCWYYWPDLLHGCQECLQMLKPGAKMYIGSKSKLQITMLEKKLLQDISKDRVFSTEVSQLEHALRTAGFIDVKSVEMNQDKPLISRFVLTECTKKAT